MAVAAAALLVFVIIKTPGRAALALFGIIGVAFAAYSLITGLSVEYEYCFVNGELTVDKITNKSNWMRETLLAFIYKNIDEDYPTLFNELEMRR